MLGQTHLGERPGLALTAQLSRVVSAFAELVYPDNVDNKGPWPGAGLGRRRGTSHSLSLGTLDPRCPASPLAELRAQALPPAPGVAVLPQ